MLSARRKVCTRITAGPPVNLTTWTSTLHDHWPLFVVNIGIGAAVPWVVGGVHSWLVSMRSFCLLACKQPSSVITRCADIQWL